MVLNHMISLTVHERNESMSLRPIVAIEFGGAFTGASSDVEQGQGVEAAFVYSSTDVGPWSSGGGG